jgi:hypothetical protein
VCRCLTRAIGEYKVTAPQLNEAWLRGGTALQDLLFSYDGVRKSMYGEYLAIRGGFKGKVRPC